MTEAPSILQKIVAEKQKSLAERKQAIPLAQLKAKIAGLPVCKPFAEVIHNRVQQHKAAVIAEIKKASPSQGVIREPFDPIMIAQEYECAGAACLSILTDEPFFQGKDEYLTQVRAVTELPLLRKDFMVDTYQIYEARVIGADCVLLIAAILDVQQMQELEQVAFSLGLSVLVEVHTVAELEKALSLSTALVGINNRDLHTFVVDLNTCVELARHMAGDRCVVAESGIHTSQDVERLQAEGIYAFLVGEAFMRAPSPGAALRGLFQSDE